MAKQHTDYRSILYGQKPKSDLSSQNTHWWNEKGKEAANGISATLNLLHQNQQSRLTEMVNHARLYGNMTFLAPLLLNSSARGVMRQKSNPGNSSYNIIQSVIDTVTAKVAKNKPEPWFVTSGGNFHQQRRAQRLTDYVNGVFYENRVHPLAQQAFRDASVWGSGLIHVFAENGRVKLERVMPAELYIDEFDAFYRQPRQMHRVKAVDRQVLMDAYPKFAKELSNTSPAKLDGGTALGGTASDLLQVRESWHLRSGPDAKDGRHMITVDDIVLFTEEWDKDFFPFAKIDWAPRQYGYWGQGLAEQLRGIQFEINQLSWVAQRSFAMAGSYKVFLKAGSKVVKEHLNDQVGAIVDYAGDTAPQYVVPPIISPQHLDRIETLKRSAYEQAGVSQLSASSQKPAGLNSGKALREFNDIESDRFATVAQGYEQLFLDLAHLTVAAARDIAEAGEKVASVRSPGRNKLKELDWKQCELDESEYVTKVFPVSSLPNEPAGRLQTIQEYIQAGMMSPSTGRRLLDFPDLQAQESLANAQDEYLHLILDRIVDDGEFTAPEALDNLQEARELALQYYAHGKSSDLEQERLQQLRDFIEQIDGLMQEAAQPAPAGQGGQPQASPEPTPQSDLIPNVPGMQQAA